MTNILKPFEKFVQIEASSGLILMFSALIALFIANSNFAELYFSLLHYNFWGLTLHQWVNDGLMTIFFFLMGMEIKRELLVGELSSPQKAALPIVAAMGGMVVPAAIYYFFNSNDVSNLHGWGIPMATDIAFALGVLSLFGKRVPVSLKVFLLALAIVDDLGAVLVIAFFYTEKISGQYLGLGALVFGLINLSRIAGVRSYFVYVVLGSVIWVAFMFSGVHATIAGVILGFMTPLKFPVKKKSDARYSPLEYLVHLLHPWVSFGIMPLFALANTGIDLRGIEFTKIIFNPIHQGVALGLIFGKSIGIMATCFIAERLKIAILPEKLKLRNFLGISFLAGIGFTMSLFISELALKPDQELYSKTGILLGSLCSAIIGAILIYITAPKMYIKDQ
ncbi:MAG: Na+/H+ antiporter NhaA [Bdellovibrionales bacterium RBG_16_40_8]|nr:MAG: Na+/H+ antiporter NhaA [Bdellovibrionales bacterium RBG_16_40_8]